MAAAASIVAAAALGAGAALWMRPVPVPRLMKLAVLPPAGTSFLPGSIVGPPALSPDGRMLAFVAEQAGEQSLWVRPLDSLSAREISGTEGARSPFWSPDSRTIGFFLKTSCVRLRWRVGRRRPSPASLEVSARRAHGEPATISSSRLPISSIFYGSRRWRATNRRYASGGN